METVLSLRDLILDRINRKKSILELEAYNNFKADLSSLINKEMIKPVGKEMDYMDYPYEFYLTARGEKSVRRER